jgi:hypothetical protein
MTTSNNRILIAVIILLDLTRIFSLDEKQAMEQAAPTEELAEVI